MASLDNVHALHRPTLHEELVGRLEQMIVEGVLPADSKVPERALCEKLGVSRTPMREALKVLAADGLVVLQPNRGARVSAVTLRELEESFPIMGAFEALAGELACERMTDAMMARLRTEHVQMVDCHRSRELQAYFRHNQRIHELISEAAGNRTLQSMYHTLATRMRRARYLANMSDERWQAAVEEHEWMMEALEARDGRRLAAILKLHLQNKFDAVRQWMHEHEHGDAG